MPVALDRHSDGVLQSTSETAASSAPEGVPSQSQEVPPPEASPSTTLETALAWLQRLRPADVLALLRDPELAYVVARAFLGFRVNADSYRNPLVRSRLAQEIVRDIDLQERFQALVDAAPPSTTSTEPKTTEPTAPSAVDLVSDLRREREQRKRDRAEARAALDEEKKANLALRRDLENAQSALADAVAERDVLRDTLSRSNQRVARLERQINRLKSERDSLLKSLPSTTPIVRQASPPSTAPIVGQAALPVTSDSPSHPSPLESGAYRLLSQDKIESALDIAEAALREDPRDVTALDIALTAYRRLGKRDKAVEAARDLVAATLATADIGRATKALLTLFTIDPQSGLISTISKPYVVALRNTPRPKLRDLSSTLAAARAANPPTYRRFVRLVEEYVPVDIAAILLDSADTLRPTDPLPLQMPGPVTALTIVAAIDAGAEDTVAAIRAELDRLRGAHPVDYDRAVDAVVHAADESYLNPLLRRTHGPIVIDASNAAWYDESRGVADRPRLSQILALRTAARVRGYFPIVLIGDAPLPHTIDERDKFAKMMARHEIMLVSTGTDADEAILREARRLNAPIVTNDYMSDWDPDNEVEKIRYIIPSAGPALLLS